MNESVKNSLTERFIDEDRMYTYVKTYAAANALHQTLKVLPLAKEAHKGQVRKGKEQVPYIYHPLLIACHALALGLNDDNLISAALLHDVCEDCDISAEELPVNEETKTAVVLLTKTSSMKREEYYHGIEENETAILIKLLDRCSNVSGMAAGFSKEKMTGYIKETEKWIYPLFQKLRTNFPKYSNQIFLIKYHISSVVEAMKRQL